MNFVSKFTTLISIVDFEMASGSEETAKVTYAKLDYREQLKLGRAKRVNANDPKW